MTRGFSPEGHTQADGPGDAEGLAVLLLAVVLAVGTLMPRFWPSATGFPPAAGADAVGQPAERIETPAEAEPPGSGRLAGVRPAPSKSSPVGPLDLNTADAEAFQTLPGVGPTLAGRIVADRNAHGPFRAPADLLRVPGIGPKRWERIRPLVRVAEGS
jgi:competence ComEA-like helix-hairpin-helix protein